VRKVAATEERCADSLKIRTENDGMVAEVHVGAWRGLISLGCEKMIPAGLKREVRRSAGALYARQVLKALQQTLVEALDVRVLFVVRLAQAERRGENMLRMETWLGLEDALKAAKQQAGTDEQDHGECHFDNDQSSAQAI